MCKTYNTIGSISTLKVRLENNNIYDFKSLKEVIDFQSSFTTKRQQLFSHHENLIEQEKAILKTELQQLDAAIEMQIQQSERALTDEIERLKQQLSISSKNTSTNFFKLLTNNFRQWNYKRQIRLRESSFDIEVNKTISKLVDNRQDKIGSKPVTG